MAGHQVAAVVLALVGGTFADVPHEQDIHNINVSALPVTVHCAYQLPLTRTGLP